MSISQKKTLVRASQIVAQGIMTSAPDTFALLSIQGLQQQLQAFAAQLANLTKTSPSVPGGTNLGYDNIRPQLAEVVNKSGVKLYPGQVLVQDTSTNDGVTLTNSAYARAIGTVGGHVSARISNWISGQALVLISAAVQIDSSFAANVGGVAPIKVNTQSSRFSVVRGAFLATDNTNGCARVAAATDSNIMAIALESLAHGTQGIINALLLPPVPIPAGGSSNPLVLTNATTGHTTTLFQDSTNNEFTIKSQVMRGNPGNALSFDGSTKYVTLASPVTMGTNASISFWVKPTWLLTHNMFTGQQVLTTNYFSWYQPSKTWYLAAGGVGSTIVYDETALAGTWMHIMLIKTGGSYELFINNTSRGTMSNAGALVIDAFANIYFGSYWMEGLMDEFAIFDHALNSTERDYEWNSGAGVSHTGSETGLLNCYHFDQTAGTAVTDSKGGDTGTTHSMIDADWVAGHIAGTSALVTETAFKMSDVVAPMITGAITTETISSDTTITVSISGKLYKLLAYGV